MPIMPIASYAVQVARSTSAPFAWISLTGPVLSHGIQNRAMLYFFPSYSQLGGYVMNVGGLNFDGITVIAQIPHGDFDRMYDLLRNEAPVQLFYTHGTSSTTTKPLNTVAILTGEEPPGEGPADADALEASIRSFVKLKTLELT